MSELEKLANISEQFVIGDKVYKVKALSLMQIATIRQELIDVKKSQLREDIKEILTNDKDKLAALRAIKVLDTDLDEMMQSKLGITLVLSKVLKLEKNIVSEMIEGSDSELSDNLWDAYCLALGVNNKDTEDIKDIKPVDTDKEIEAKKV